jgi:hypothetical protein
MARSVCIRLAIVVVAAVAGVSCGAGPGVVSKLTVVNSTSYDLEVNAANAASRDRVLLGRVQRGQTISLDQVDDLGDVWVFTFDFPGPLRAGEVRIARDELVRRRWRIEVPDEVEQRLRSMGVKPSPILE